MRSRPLRLAKRLTPRFALRGSLVLALALLSWRIAPTPSTGHRSLANSSDDPVVECSLAATLTFLQSEEYDSILHEELLAEDQIVMTRRVFDTENSYTIHRITSHPEGEIAELTLLPERTWYSNAGKKSENPQNDPRVPIMALGPRAGRGFGFATSHDGRSLRVPLASRARWTIQELVGMGVPRGLDFFDDTGKTPTPDALDRFIDAGQLAIGRGRELLGHDLGYHFMAILIPPPVVAHARAQVRFLRDFTRALQRRTPDTLRAQVASRIETLQTLSIIAIDRGTGDFGRSMRRPFRDLPDLYRTEAVNTGLRRFTHQGRSPFEALQNMILQSGSAEPELRAHINQALQEAVSTARARGDDIHQTLNYSDEQFLREVSDRYDWIQAGASELAPADYDPFAF